MPGERQDDRFAEYLDSLRGLLKINRQRRNQIEDELRDHVEERVGELTARGMESEAATALALSEFGDAATLAADFSQVTRHSKRNQIMRLCTTTAAIALILFMGFSMLHPNGPTEGTAQTALPPVTQQAETPAPSMSPASLSVNQDERNEATRELLSETSVDLDLIEMPVGDCLDYLKEECEGMQWYASASASGYAPHSADNSGPYGDYAQSASYMGINISITLSDIPAEMALRLVLDQAGLGYYLDNGVVIVTDVATAAARLDIRVYDISGLIAAVEANPTAGTAYSPQTNYYAPNSYQGHPQEYTQSLSSKDVASQIIELVLSVGPDTWDEVGGPGSVNVFQNALVVRQTEEVHLQLEEFLKVVESVVSNPAGNPGQDWVCGGVHELPPTEPPSDSYPQVPAYAPPAPTSGYTDPTPQHPPQTPTTVPPTPYRQTPYPADQQPQLATPPTPAYVPPQPPSGTISTPQTPTPPQPIAPQATPTPSLQPTPGASTAPTSWNTPRATIPPQSGYASPTYQPAPPQHQPQAVYQPAPTQPSETQQYVAPQVVPPAPAPVTEAPQTFEEDIQLPPPPSTVNDEQTRIPLINPSEFDETLPTPQPQVEPDTEEASEEDETEEQTDERPAASYR